MDEGVDPTQMCQKLVDKVARSKQLQAVTDPELLVLFEDWLEEIEQEVIEAVDRSGSQDLRRIAAGTGLSAAGANFMVTKLKREGRI